MKSIFYKSLASLMMLVSVVMYGQERQPSSPPPTPFADGPGGDEGTPIDMYIPLLAIMAILMIVLYIRNKKLAKN